MTRRLEDIVTLAKEYEALPQEAKALIDRYLEHGLDLLPPVKITSLTAVVRWLGKVDRATGLDLESEAFEIGMVGK